MMVRAAGVEPGMGFPPPNFVLASACRAGRRPVGSGREAGFDEAGTRRWPSWRGMAGKNLMAQGT
jgi:hypothetical protein